MYINSRSFIQSSHLLTCGETDTLLSLCCLYFFIILAMELSSLNNKSGDMLDITCNTDEYSNNQQETENLNKALRDLSNCHITDDSYIESKNKSINMNEEFLKMDSKINYIYQLLTDVLDKLNRLQPSQPKHEKISFNNNDDEPFISNFTNCRGCFIFCNSNKNFGKVVGKNGANIEFMIQKYNVTVEVPPISITERFKAIALIDYNTNPNSYNFEMAKKYVLNLLLFN